jgi:integrase
MGRRRTISPTWLPRRVYPHRRQLVYRPKIGKPIALGSIEDPGACLKKYAELIGGSGKRPVTMGEVLDKFVIEIVPGKAARTQEDYRRHSAKLKQAFGHMLPDEIEIADLYAYHEARKAPVQANREITVLGVIYRHAIRWRAATRIPVQGFLFAEERPRDRLVTGRERRLFAAHYCPNWLRAYILLKYLTGRRQGELLRLGKFSVQRAGLAVRITKKRRERELLIEWTPRLRAVVDYIVEKLRRSPSSLMLFHGERGKPVTARALKSVWQRAMTRWEADGNTRFWEHDIRAETASDAGNDERARELLDHENVRTTRRVYRRGDSKVKPLR